MSNDWEWEWECGPHTNSWKGHDARCRKIRARVIHLVDPPCGAQPDGKALFFRWRESVTCPKCLAGSK